MAGQQKCPDPVRPPHGPDTIRKLPDPQEAVMAALAWTEYARARVREGLDLRDEGLRRMQASGLTMPEIARRTGVSLGTVKAALR